MSSKVSSTFKLTGVHEGKTIKLGKYHFVDGSITLSATPEDIALHARSLHRNWGVVHEGFDYGQRDLQASAQQNGQRAVSGDLQPSGQGTQAGGSAEVGGGNAADNAGSQVLVADGNGHAPSVNQKLVDAIAKLDPANDADWIGDGRPAIAAVQTLYGSTDITRADVEAAAPGFVRPTAE